MDNYISTKTVFINKLYDKFHKKNIEEKILVYNKKMSNEYFTNIGTQILFKYKYYIFEASQNIAEEIFWRFLKNRVITKVNFFKNFEIQTYEDNMSLENKENTKDTIYINRYQISFFYFWIRSMFIFKKLDEREAEIIDAFIQKNYL